MKKWLNVKTLGGLAKFLYQNRKAEVALAAAVIALLREAIQAATGH